MKISKRNKIIFGTGILLIVIVLIASSFAYWQLVRTQSDDNALATGCFDVTFTEESAAIKLEDAYPISDEEGMDTDPYTFKIKNTCEMYASYQVNLEVIDTSTLLSKNVKVVLDNNTTKILTGYESVTPTIETADESYKLITGKLDPEQEITYDLRMWMDKDTSIEEGSNKTFKSKITIIAVPIEAPSGVEIQNNLKYLIGSNNAVEAVATGKAKNKTVTWTFTSSDGGVVTIADPSNLSTIIGVTTEGTGTLTVTTENNYSDSVEVTIYKVGAYIYTANQLSSIGVDPNYPLNGNYVLMNDIDISTCTSTPDEYGATGATNCDSNWTPIGTSTFAFSGSFDGTNHTISNMTIDSVNSRNHGLFGDVYNSKEIKNIKIDNAKLTSHGANGILVGSFIGSGKIINCHVTNSIIYRSTNSGTGGLVGSLYHSGEYIPSVIKSSASVEFIVTAPGAWYSVGGLIGYAGKTIITESYSIAEFNCTGNTCTFGGLTGVDGGNISKISNSYAIFNAVNNVYSTYTYPFVESKASIVENCYAYATIVGSPIGKYITAGVDSDKTLAELKNLATYAGWDFETVWKIEPTKNNGLPYLRWQDELE